MGALSSSVCGSTVGLTDKTVSRSTVGLTDKTVSRSTVGLTDKKVSYKVARTRVICRPLTNMPIQKQRFYDRDTTKGHPEEFSF